jgi:hypothetical protein
VFAIKQRTKTKTMTLQQLFKEAQTKWINGYSESRLVDFVFSNAKNDTQANKILSKVLRNK